MARSPYADLPPKAFWRNGVAAAPGPVAQDLYTRKWPLRRSTRIATAGSCFAQHIGRHLRSRGFTILDVEPAPMYLPAERRAEFGYGIYSARYGNVYTVRQMLQLAQEALGIIPQRNIVWSKDGRHFDALRPTVEPEGLSSPAVVAAHRTRHLARVRQMLMTMDVLVFTLGLTETWLDARDGTVFPVCPGTVSDDFDPAHHVFHNVTTAEVRADFLALRDLLRAARPPGQELRFLLTVSPVPLTATAAGTHVQMATVHSKAVLRAVAGELAAEFADIDYFPSYEIITSPWSGQRFYAANQRSVTPEGVACVMDLFMVAHGGAAQGGAAQGMAGQGGAGQGGTQGGATAPQAATAPEPAAAEPAAAAPEAPALAEDPEMMVVCDEELLDAFGARAP
jgi:hypothetical protein